MSGWLVILTVFAMLVVCAVTPLLAQNDDTPAAAYVNKIVFVGNENISDGELKSRMKTKTPAFYNIFRKPRLDTDVLNRDIAQLEGHYHSAGFFEAVVNLERLDYSEDGRFVDVVITVHEGKPTLVESVEFSPNSLVEHNELRKNLLLKPGEPYNASYLNTDVYTLQTKYFNRGYLAVSIEESVELSEYRVSVYFDIETGTRIDIRSIDITGNVLSNDSVISKEIAFKPGDVCRLGKLVETQRNMYETGLFTVVDISPENLDPVSRTVDIRIRVRERKAAYVETGFGVGNILGSRIFAEWGTRNLVGSGRGLRIGSEYGFDLFEGNAVDFDRLQLVNSFWRYDAEYQQRYVFGIKLLMSLSAFVEKDATVENIEVRKVGASLSSRRRFTRSTDMLLGLSDEFIRRSALGEPENESESRFVSGSISHDKRDFILNPKTGTYRFLRLKLAGGLLGGDNDFYTANVSFQWYRPFHGGVLAIRLRAGYGDHFGHSEEVPIEDRFFAGGANSVRGYKDDSLGPTAEDGNTGEFVPKGGNALLLSNVELRFSVPLLSRINISGAMFMDGGNVWGNVNDIRPGHFELFKDRSDIGRDDYRYGVGMGLRYNTPVGPIRLDYGIPLKIEESVSDKGRFHLSLGQAF